MVRAQFGKSSSTGNKEGACKDVHGALEQMPNPDPLYEP